MRRLKPLKYICFIVINFVAFLSAFQEQHLLSAVQSGILQRINRVLIWLKQLNNCKSTGNRGKGGPKGTKKIGVTDRQGQIREESKGGTTAISKTVLEAIHQRSSANQNVLHICCRNPTYTEKGENVDAISKGKTYLQSLQMS